MGTFFLVNRGTTPRYFLQCIKIEDFQKCSPTKNLTPYMRGGLEIE